MTYVIKTFSLGLIDLWVLYNMLAYYHVNIICIIIKISCTYTGAWYARVMSLKCLSNWFHMRHYFLFSKQLRWFSLKFTLKMTPPTELNWTELSTFIQCYVTKFIIQINENCQYLWNTINYISKIFLIVTFTISFFNIIIC